MHYAIATTGCRRSATTPSEPDGIAHAVLSGSQVTVCGLDIAAGLFYFDEDFSRTSLPRCPECEGGVG
jgi:hypothetical protein